jgi:hypothetical protein
LAGIDAYLNTLPKGIVAKVSQTSTFGLTTTPTDVTGASVTWTADPARLYLIQSYGYVTKSTSPGYVAVYITDSSNNSKQEAFWTIGTVTGYTHYNTAVYETGLSGSITRKLRAFLGSAGGSLDAGSTFPRQLIVTDMGLA